MRLIYEAGEVRVRQCRHAALAYYRHDQHIGRSLDLYGEWAEGELELLGLFIKPGSTVLDIGANLGTHATFFARKTGPAGLVLAFEPQRAVHALLTTNFTLNDFTAGRAVHAAVGSKAGTLTVPTIDYSHAGNFGGLALGSYEQGEAVPVLTIDSLGLSGCSLVKINVEGMEHDVLKGAAATLARYQPVVYLENNGPEGAPGVVSLLTELGYTLRWHFSSFFRMNNFAGSKDNVFGELVDANMLAVPPSIAEATAALPKVIGPSDTAADALRRNVKH